MLKKFPSEPLSLEMSDAVRKMAYMAEYRDPNIINHMDRMRGYSLIMASNLGLSKQEADLVANACLLHDVGKISLPEYLETKAENLSPQEWEIMKKHTTFGADLLKDSSATIFQTASLIAFTHHERWNGSGYPQGLRGDNIPLTGRICAVADVFDALITHRPYKEEIPVAEAIQLIQNAGGELFDPQVIKVFMLKIDDIIRVFLNNPQSSTL